MRRYFKVGDKVKIKNIGDNVDGKKGVIISIDGAYHYVQIGRNKDRIIELYSGEMELEN